MDSIEGDAKGMGLCQLNKLAHNYITRATAEVNSTLHKQTRKMLVYTLDWRDVDGTS